MSDKSELAIIVTCDDVSGLCKVLQCRTDFHDLNIWLRITALSLFRNIIGSSSCAGTGWRFEMKSAIDLVATFSCSVHCNNVVATLQLLINRDSEQRRLLEGYKHKSLFCGTEFQKLFFPSVRCMRAAILVILTANVVMHQRCVSRVTSQWRHASSVWRLVLWLKKRQWLHKTSLHFFLLTARIIRGSSIKEGVWR